MISKKDLKDYEFESLEDYFQYIVDSKINGQLQQLRNLISELSKSQSLEFYEWLNSDIHVIAMDGSWCEHRTRVLDLFVEYLIAKS